MRHRRVSGNVKVKPLIAVLLIAAVIGVSLVFARQVHMNMQVEGSLKRGQEEFAQENWAEAAKDLRGYLRVHPDDTQILRMYATACLNVRPLGRAEASGAISAYRQILKLEGLDEAEYETLVELLVAVDSFADVEQLARTRLVDVPDDATATLWLVEALIQQDKIGQAEAVLKELVGSIEAAGGKSDAYVRACVRISGLTAARQQEASDEESEAPTGENTAEKDEGEPAESPLEWLDRAVAYAPDSVEGLAHRARFYRRKAEDPNGTEQEMQAFAALARTDLEAASAIGTDDASLCCMLVDEWIALRGFEQAEALLQKMKELPEDVVAEYFFDENDWTVAQFTRAARLAMRRGASTEVVPLADETLASVKSEYHRAEILPLAVPLYAAAGRASDASAALEEYLEIAPKFGIEVEPRWIAWLKSLVEGSADRPYAVIDTLEPVVGDDMSSAGQLRMLAQAYAETGQTSRAIEALTKYLQLFPNETESLVELARLYSRQGDWRMASEVAQRAQSAGATDPLLKLLHVGAGISSMVSQGRIEPEQVNSFSSVLTELRQEHPSRVDIRLFQAILANLLDRPEEAERELRLAIEECEETLRAEMQLVRHYHANERRDEALRVCETACERHPDVAAVWMALADLHLAGGDVEAGRGCFEEALDTISADRQKRLVTIKLALLELTRGDRTDGIALLKGLAAGNPQEVQARLLLLGTPEIRVEDPDAAQTLVSELRQAEGQTGLWWRLHQASLWLASDNWQSHKRQIGDLLEYCISADPTWPAPVLALAGMYSRLGETDRVEALYRQGLLANPSATELADPLLALLEEQQRFVDAERILRQISRNPRAQYWRPRILEGMGDYSRAIEEYRLRVSNDPQDDRSRIQLARLIYQETGDAGQAMRYLEEARAISPDSRTLNAVQASILRGEGQDAEAVQVLDDYVADYNSFDAYWLRAVYLAERGEVDRAEEDYRKLTSFANGDAGYELLANFQAGLGNLDQAVATVEEGMEAYPEDLRLKRRLMEFLLQRGQPEDRDRALAILAELRETFPDDPALMTIWAIEKVLGETTTEALTSAQEILQEAVRRNPRYTRAWTTLIEVLMRLGEVEVAAEEAVQALQANPDEPALLLARARAELMLQHAHTAFGLARQVLRDNPDHLGGLMMSANAALASTNPTLLEEAKTVFDNAIRRLPDSPELLMLRAQVCDGLGRPREAIPALQAYCQTESGRENVDALVTLVDLHRIAGDLAQAEKALVRAQELAPGHQVVVHARLMLRIAQDRLPELVGISQAYREAEQQSLRTSQRAASRLWSLDPPELKQEGFKLLEYNAKTWPSSLQTRLALAMACYATGQMDRSRELYEELLDEFPNNTVVLNDLAWILQESAENYERALELANRGLRVAPNDESLLDTRATVFTNMPDRLVDAKKDFDTIRRLCLQDPQPRPRLATTLLKLARVCVALEEIPEAKQHATRALEVNAELNVLDEQERAEISSILQMDSVASEAAPTVGGD